jgi:hypothetical protein
MTFMPGLPDLTAYVEALDRFIAPFSGRGLGSSGHGGGRGAVD